MDKFKEIRPVALGIAVRDGKLLASKGYDEVKKVHFYRAIGGGIEFLEKSDEALKREFMEEINANVTVDEFLGISENIFTFNGKQGHELIFLYRVILDESDYKEVYFEEGDTNFPIEWVDIENFKSGKAIIYPTLITKYLQV